MKLTFAAYMDMNKVIAGCIDVHAHFTRNLPPIFLKLTSVVYYGADKK
jgi:hypothetical protein